MDKITQMREEHNNNIIDTIEQICIDNTIPLDLKVKLIGLFKMCMW